MVQLFRGLIECAVRIPVELRGDIRYGIRTLAGAPSFTAVALISLSLGIAVASAAFSIMNGLVLRDVPAIREADGLLLFERPLSYPDYKRYRDRESLFSASTATSGSDRHKTNIVIRYQKTGNRKCPLSRFLTYNFANKLVQSPSLIEGTMSSWQQIVSLISRVRG